MKIIFLDFDGPLVSHRAKQFKPKRSQSRIEFLSDLPEPIDDIPQGIDPKTTCIPIFDPVAVSLIENLALGHLASIVVTSSWRKVGRRNIEEILEINGISARRLHLKWRTEFVDKIATRSQEIAHWISQADQNGDEITSYVAIDDDPNVLNLPGGILVPYSDGMRWSDYCSASAALGGGIEINDFDLIKGDLVAEVSEGLLGERPVERHGNMPTKFNFGPISMEPGEAPAGCVRCTKSAYQLVRIATADDHGPTKRMH